MDDLAAEGEDDHLVAWKDMNNFPRDLNISEETFIR